MVKQLDGLVASAADNKATQKAFLVLLTDDPEDATDELEALAKKHGIKNVPLTFYDGILGPGGYRIARNAEVTVMMWKDDTVRINRAFGRGAFDDRASKALVAQAKEFLGPKNQAD